MSWVALVLSSVLAVAPLSAQAGPAPPDRIRAARRHLPRLAAGEQQRRQRAARVPADEALAKAQTRLRAALHR